MINVNVSLVAPSAASVSPEPAFVVTGAYKVSPPPFVPTPSAPSLKLVSKLDVNAPGVAQTARSAASATSGLVVPAACSTTDAIGAWVYVTSSQQSYLAVTTADPKQAYQPVVGLLVDKGDDGSCQVALGGLVDGIFTNLSPGAAYFLGPTGTTILPPLTASSIVYVQQVGIAVGPSTMLVMPTQRIKRSFT